MNHEHCTCGSLPNSGAMPDDDSGTMPSIIREALADLINHARYKDMYFLVSLVVS